MVSMLESGHAATVVRCVNLFAEVCCQSQAALMQAAVQERQRQQQDCTATGQSAGPSNDCAVREAARRQASTPAQKLRSAQQDSGL